MPLKPWVYTNLDTLCVSRRGPLRCRTDASKSGMPSEISIGANRRRSIEIHSRVPISAKRLCPAAEPITGVEPLSRDDAGRNDDVVSVDFGQLSHSAKSGRLSGEGFKETSEARKRRQHGTRRRDRQSGFRNVPSGFARAHSG